MLSSKFLPISSHAAANALRWAFFHAARVPSPSAAAQSAVTSSNGTTSTFVVQNPFAKGVCHRPNSPVEPYPQYLIAFCSKSPWQHLQEILYTIIIPSGRTNCHHFSCSNNQIATATEYLHNSRQGSQVMVWRWAVVCGGKGGQRKIPAAITPRGFMHYVFCLRKFTITCLAPCSTQRASTDTALLFPDYTVPDPSSVLQHGVHSFAAPEPR